MKSIKFICFLTFFISSFCFAQKDSLNLALEYLPNKTYTKNTTTNILMENWEKEKIIATNQNKTQSTTIITTGDLQNNSFPFSLKIISDQNSYLNNLEFKGSCILNEYPKISTVIPPSENNTLILILAKEIIKQSPVLSKKLKIGDSFTTSSPVSLPMTDNSVLEMSVIKQYTLTKMDTNFAYFTYQSKTIIKDIDYMGIKYSGGGKGKGKLVYDIKNHFFTSSKDNESTVSINMSFQGKSIILKLKMNTNEEIIIE